MRWPLPHSVAGAPLQARPYRVALHRALCLGSLSTALRTGDWDDVQGNILDVMHYETDGAKRAKMFSTVSLSEEVRQKPA